MTLADVLERLLRDEPDQTAEELYRNLGSVKSKVRQPQMVMTILKQKRDLFVEDSGGRWRLVNQPDPDPEPEVDLEYLRPRPRTAPTESSDPGAIERTSASPSRPSRAIRRATPPTDGGLGPALEARRLDRELRDRLRGSRLVAEIDLDENDLEVQEAALLELIEASSSVSLIASQLPALFVSYLVGVGVHRYDLSFWPHVAFSTNNLPVGDLLDEAIDQLDLEPFDRLVDEDNALRNLGPILAHGGIPSYCLADYFDLLNRGLRSRSTANDLLMLWQSQQTAYTSIDRPVGRFLTYGGELAVDFLDRSIDLVREYASSGTVISAEEVGLPKHVVTGFQRYLDEGGSITKRAVVRRGRVSVDIVLDPYAGSGPVAVLPPVPTDSDLYRVWHVHGTGRAESFPASSQRERDVALDPARSWTVELSSPESSDEWTIPGLGARSVLLFDPDTDRLLSGDSTLRLSSVTVVRPPKVVLAGLTSESEEVSPRVIEELPSLGGSWSGFSVERIDLDGLRMLVITDGTEAHRVPVRPGVLRPQLVGDPVAGLTDALGHPIYARMPGLELPGFAEGETSWRVRIESRDAQSRLDAGGLPSEGDVVDLPDTQECRSYTLIAQGHLGSDLRTQFTVAPGIEAAIPDRLLFPDDRATVHISSEALSIAGCPQGQAVELRVGDADDHISFSVRDSSGNEIELHARVARVLWTMLGASATQAGLGVDVAVVEASDLTDTDPARVAVRTGRPGCELRLRLESNGQLLQEIPAVTPKSRDGRTVFDLATFADSVAATDESSLDLVLWVGHQPVRVARIRPSLTVEGLSAVGTQTDEGTTVTITFHAARAVRHRVAMIWPLTRPWEEPVSHAIDDGFTGVLTIPAGIVGPGDHLVQITVDDGWTPIERPYPHDTNTTLLRVENEGSGTGQYDQLRPLDSYEPLIAATDLGYFGRHLTAEELDLIVPAATTTLVAMVKGQMLIDWTSRQFGSVAALALADRARFLAEISMLVEAGDASSHDLLRLTIALGPRAKVAIALHESVARRIWAISPPLAAAFDLAIDDDPARRDRIATQTGWDPNDADRDLPVIGQPLKQIEAAATAEQLRFIYDVIRLVPRQSLEIDAWTEATFEWLIEARTGTDDSLDTRNLIQDWADRHRDVVRASKHPAPYAEAHVTNRIATGAFSWASFPSATLAAAVQVIDGEKGHFYAKQALMDAAEFAPKLVAFDLVLARVLSSIQQTRLAGVSS